MSGTRTVRVGFVGCGNHATNSLYPNFARIPNLELVATCDLKPELAARNARLFGAPRHYPEAAAMLDQEDLEAVFVVGPPAMHAEVGTQVLEAGLHLFTEKPPAETVAAARALAETADRTGRFTQVGHMMRHAPTVRRAVEILQSEEFGAPVFAESMYFTPGPGFEEGEARQGWRYMIFQATHPIDLAHHVLGDITRVYATCGVGGNHMPAYAVAMEFAGGASGLLNLNGAAPHWTSRLDIVGDRFTQLTVTDLARLEYQRQTEGGYSFPVGRPSQRWDIPLRDNAEQRAGYLGEMEHFAECLLEGTPPYPSIRDGYRALLVCEAILESVETGKAVEIRYD